MLAELERAARRKETPCGVGRMVWRAWGEGAPLVLLHGGSGSWRHWARQIPAFAQTRLVLAPDLPGLGESDDPPGETPEAVAGVVADGVGQVLGGVAGVDLAGFSFGAIIAGHVAARLPLRRLAILGAGGLGTARSPVPLVKVRDKARAEREAAHRANLASLMIADPARIDALALEIQEANSAGARLRSRQFAPSATLLAALRRAPAPLTAIWGARDAVAWPNLAGRIAVLREARPDATVHVVRGAGHWVGYEAAGEVNAILRDALP